MKLLIAVAQYTKPNKNPSHRYIQTRNEYYKEQGLDVTVLNFGATFDYTIDGIKVISVSTYLSKYIDAKFDLLVCHAPNLKDHYLFLKRYQNRFPKLVFFFHGHEVLRTSKVYSKPYPFVKSPLYMRTAQDVYDILKLYIWRKYYPKLIFKSHFVFVSKWMYDEFIKWTRISPEILNKHMSITYNSVGRFFESSCYKKSNFHKYDFLTIRSRLDGSKYSIDIVTRLAKQNKQYKFCIVGKGDYFKYNIKPDNITLIHEYLTHEQIIHLLNEAACALMPTRTDSQGLMACEMATYGMPVITSNIPVCHEIFDGFENVAYIDNDDYNINLTEVYARVSDGVPFAKNPKYFAKNTSAKEIELFYKIMEKGVLI